MKDQLDADHIAFPRELDKYMMPALKPADDFSRHNAYVDEARHLIHEASSSSGAPVRRQSDYIVRCSLLLELFRSFDMTSAQLFGDFIALLYT